MARPSTQGSVRLNPQQKEAFAVTRGVLGFEQKEITEAMKAWNMDWDASSLSSAVSPKLSPDKTRPINRDRLLLLERFLRERLAQKRPALSEPEAMSVEDALSTLFPKISETSAGRRVLPPGELLTPDYENRIEPDWERVLRDYVVGSGTALQPRVWVLGGPKTGKSVTLKRVETMAAENGLNVLPIDVKTLAESFPESTEARGSEAQILEQILQLAFRTNDRLGPANVHPSVLVSRFIDQLRERSRLYAGGRRLIITLDHLYLFGPQYGNANAAFRKAFGDIHLNILLGLREFNVPLSTIFIVDDGAAASNDATTRYWAKGKCVKCFGDSDTLNAVWVANHPNPSEGTKANSVWTADGTALMNPDIFIHLEALGRSIFLHHAAAYLAATQSELCDINKACAAVVDAVAHGKPTPDEGVTAALRSFRRRIIGWLRLKASHCHVDYHELCQALAQSRLAMLDLDDDTRVELDVALEIGGFYGDPRKPSGVIQELARVEREHGEGKQ